MKTEEKVYRRPFILVLFNLFYRLLEKVSPEEKLARRKAFRHWKQNHRLIEADMYDDLKMTFADAYNVRGGYLYPKYGRGNVVCRHPECRRKYQAVEVYIK